MKVTPFTEADLEEASVLLARRHQEDRVHEQALPERFTDPAEARTELEKVWQASRANGVNAGGVVARANGKMIGYLIGVPRIDATWGRSVWVDLAGHALDRSYSAELYRDLYAIISPTWVAAGCLFHVANIPANDSDALHAWHHLSFGNEHTYGIRETAPASAFDVPSDPTLEVRRATPADADLSMELDQVLGIHQSRAPVYSIVFPYNREEERQDTLEMLGNEQWKTWLAVRDGRLVGIQVYLPAKAGFGTGLLPIPEKCSFLGFAVTSEKEQGRGVGRILTARGLSDDYESGYTTCFTDWRATNLLSSRFWPRQGWRPVVYRLSRRLDERVLWAHEGASPRPWQMHRILGTDMR